MVATILYSIFGTAASLVTLGLSSVGAYGLATDAGVIGHIPAVDQVIHSF